MTNQFPELKRKFIRIMEEELDQAYLTMLYQTVRALLVQLSMLVVDVFPGTSKIPLWDTVKLFDSRINILLVFGEKVGSYTNACVQPREELTWKTANDPILASNTKMKRRWFAKLRRISLHSSFRTTLPHNALSKNSLSVHPPNTYTR
jgi:hypothetical protein